MSDIKKPEDIGSKLQSISNDVNAASLPKIVSTYNVGRANDFSAKQANLAKYATYGSQTYGKLGFDPYKSSHTEGKSGMDELYDEKTSWTADIGRAYTGMKKLAGIGLQDTFGLGELADQGNYLTFEDTMNKYSSSRGGNTGFWSNTMLSSGYTMGIIGGIALEEMALAGVTALSGGTAAPGTIAAGGTLLARGVARIKEAGNMLKAVNKLQDLNTAKSFMGATGKFVGGSVKGFAKALNPLENTFDFLKTIDKLEDFNGWRQTAIGAGAIVRDARKITMSHSESKLEADLAAKEFKQQMFDDYYLDKSNRGTEIPESQLKLIDDEAQKVRDRVYSANFGLIYATNAITFDNMFKSMKGTNRWAGVANDSYRILRKEGGKVAVEALQKTLGNAIRKKASQLTLKSALNSAISSSMEGFQELGQDVISESLKSYHARNVKGTQVRGGFMEYLHNDLEKAAAKQNSEEGFSTFLSGALMGVFASPVGFATGQVNNFIAEGGMARTYQRVTDNKKWKADKLNLEEKRKEKAKVLTEFFNDNKNFIDGFSKPIYSQNELQETILQAAEDKDPKALNNAKHDSFVTGVHTLLEAGLENEFASHLEYMAKNFGAKELNEVFGRTDITDENAPKYQQKLQKQAEQVKTLRAKYNEIQETIVNPHNMKGMKPSDPNYLDKYIQWRAVENLKKELLFSDSKIADRANRLVSIQKEINESNPLSSLEINSLLNTDSLTQQVDLLKAEVEANKAMTLTGAGKENADKAQAKLDAFTAYQEKLNAFTSEQNKEEGAIYESDAYDDLFDAYNDVMKAFGKNTLSDESAQTLKNKKQFDKIFDYISLGEENKYYQEYVDTLLSPSGSNAFLQGQEDMLKRLDENKEEHITNALKAFEEKSTADDMLNALYNEGLFFDLNELDDLIKNRIMPSQIYDIEDNNKEATPEQVKIAQEIIGKFIKKLTGKTIVNDKTSLNKQGRKLSKDKRTVAGILRQYGIKVDQEIDLSTKKGQRLLDKILAKDNTYLTRLDREILSKLGDQNVKVKFITDGTLPIQIAEDGTILMDLRFAGRDFKNSSMSFENLMVTGLTQHKITEELKNNDALWLSARNAMEQAKAVFKKTFPSENVETIDVFNDPALFITDAMNDMQFQKFLSQIEDDIQPATNSLWDTLMSGIKEIISEEFDKKLINRVINISAKALDSSIVDNIAEEAVEEAPVEETPAEEVINEETPVEEVPINDDARERVVTEDVDVVTEDEEAPETEETKTKEELLNDAEKLAKRIAEVEKEIDNLNTIIADSKLSYLKKRSARIKITELSIELNELYERLNDIQPALDDTATTEEINETGADYAAMYDYNGNEIITHETPWQTVPKELRESLAVAFGKSLTKLNQEDVNKIRQEMKSNPVYIKLISDFTEGRLRAQDLIKNQEEVLENQKRIEEAKLARQQQLLEEKEANRLAKKQKKKLKAPVSDENFLKNLLKDFDFSILDAKEIKMLVDKFKNNTDGLPFTVTDIVSYITSKQAKQQAKANERQLRDDIEKLREQRKIDKQITSNFNLLLKRRFSYPVGKKVINVRVTPRMVKFIATYHPEIFKEDQLTFMQSVKQILDVRKNEVAKVKETPFTFKEKGVNFQLIALVKKLEKDKLLFPEVVYQINLALYKAGSNMRVRAVRSGKNSPLSTMYTIGKKYANERRSLLKRPSLYSGKKKAILDADLSMFSDEKQMEITILQKLIQGTKVRRRALIKGLGQNNKSEIKSWMGITSKDAPISMNSADSASVEMLSEFPGVYEGKFDDTNMVPDAFEAFLLKYKNLADAIDRVHKDIINAVPENEEPASQYTDEEQDELLFLQDLEESGMTKDEAVEELSKLKFLSSKEGQELLDQEAEALYNYYNSAQAEIVNGEFEGDVEELSDEDGELFNSSQKNYDPEDAEAANDMANEEGDSFDESEKDPNADFFEGIEKVEETEIAKTLNAIVENGVGHFNHYSYLGSLMDSLNTNKKGDLVHAIAVYKYRPSSAKAILNSQFRVGIFNNKNVVVNNKAYRVAGYQSQKIVLQDLSSLKYENFSLEEFMDGVTEVLAPGAEFSITNIDTVVNVGEFDYIKGAYDEILNNFTSFMGEANALSEEDLMADLNKEITKCK